MRFHQLDIQPQVPCSWLLTYDRGPTSCYPDCSLACIDPCLRHAPPHPCHPAHRSLAAMTSARHWLSGAGKALAWLSYLQDHSLICAAYFVTLTARQTPLGLPAAKSLQSPFKEHEPSPVETAHSTHAPAHSCTVTFFHAWLSCGSHQSHVRVPLDAMPCLHEDRTRR